MYPRMILDQAEAIGMGALENLRLVRELKTIRASMEGAGTGPAAALKKMRLVVQLKAIRARLGAASAPNPNTQALADIAGGKKDDLTLLTMWASMKDSVDTLEEAGELAGEAEALAHAAITHWARLEEKING